uniref:Uncharacterized protein n=1 Tax=Anopheles darlingi TaxID=43151 RepID=A0A2M4D617_ANODA
MIKPSLRRLFLVQTPFLGLVLVVGIVHTLCLADTKRLETHYTHTSARKSLHTNTTVCLVGRTDRISWRMRLLRAFTFIRIVFAFQPRCTTPSGTVAVVVVVSLTFPFLFHTNRANETEKPNNKQQTKHTNTHTSILASVHLNRSLEGRK